MKAIHVNWTKPFFEKDRLRGHGFETIKNIKSETYTQPDYQLLYTILSALNWKKYNGALIPHGFNWCFILSKIWFIRFI